MDSQARIDGLYFLKRNLLFGPLGEMVLEELVGRLQSRPLPKGSVVCKEGEPGDAFYLLKSGRVRIVTHSEKGEEKTMAYVGRGDAIGELALLTGEPQAFGAVCDSACEF